MQELPEAGWFSCCDPPYTDKKDKDLQDKREEIMNEIHALEEITDESMDDHDLRSNPGKVHVPEKALCAFVIFGTEDDKLDILKSYRYSVFRQLTFWIFGDCCEMREELFRGKFLLRAKVAPAPSTIIWENIKYGQWYRLRLRNKTNIIALISIFTPLIPRGSKPFFTQKS